MGSDKRVNSDKSLTSRNPSKPSEVRSLNEFSFSELLAMVPSHGRRPNLGPDETELDRKDIIKVGKRYIDLLVPDTFIEIDKGKMAWTLENRIIAQSKDGSEALPKNRKELLAFVLEVLEHPDCNPQLSNVDKSINEVQRAVNKLLQLALVISQSQEFRQGTIGQLDVHISKPTGRRERIKERMKQPIEDFLKDINITSPKCLHETCKEILLQAVSNDTSRLDDLDLCHVDMIHRLRESIKMIQELGHHCAESMYKQPISIKPKELEKREYFAVNASIAANTLRLGAGVASFAANVVGTKGIGLVGSFAKLGFSAYIWRRIGKEARDLADKIDKATQKLNAIIENKHQADNIEREVDLWKACYEVNSALARTSTKAVGKGCDILKTAHERGKLERRAKQKLEIVSPSERSEILALLFLNIEKDSDAAINWIIKGKSHSSKELEEELLKHLGKKESEHDIDSDREKLKEFKEKLSENKEIEESAEWISAAISTLHVGLSLRAQLLSESKLEQVNLTEPYQQAVQLAKVFADFIDHRDCEQLSDELTELTMVIEGLTKLGTEKNLLSLPQIAERLKDNKQTRELERDVLNVHGEVRGSPRELNEEGIIILKNYHGNENIAGLPAKAPPPADDKVTANLALSAIVAVLAALKTHGERINREEHGDDFHLY